MGSHFHNWTDYNGVTLLVQLLAKNGVAHFWDFWDQNFLIPEIPKIKNPKKQRFKNRKIHG